MKAPESNIEIRPALLEDAVAIRALTRAAYAKWVPLIGREPLPMQADYERAVGEHTIDLMIVNGALVGLIEMMLQPDHLWIENVAVAPEQQGRGFGRLLLDHGERRALQFQPYGNPPPDQSGLRGQSRTLRQVRLRRRPNRAVSRRHDGPYEQAGRGPRKRHNVSWFVGLTACVDSSTIAIMKTAPRKFELTADILLRAYSIGVFPMAESSDARTCSGSTRRSAGYSLSTG